MKLLPSPSLSSSSTTTTTTTTSTIDGNMRNSTAATDCFSGLLRLILCYRGLAADPSDRFMETTSLQCEDRNSLGGAKPDAAATAARTGLVARLMGLESLPTKDDTNCPISDRNLVLSRSCSLNSVEIRGANCGAKREKIRTSVSFREMPEFLELEEEEEFFVLRFDETNNVGNCDFPEKESRMRKCKLGCKESVKRRSEEIMKNNMLFTVFDEEDLLSNEILDPGEFSEREKSRKKRNKKKKKKKKKKTQVNYTCQVKNEEPDTTSQDSSPVSVLDLGQFNVCPELLRSADEGTSSGEETKLRRKLSLELENYDYLSQCIDHDYDENQLLTTNQETSCRSWRESWKDCHGEICRLAQAEVVESNWIQQRSLNLRDLVEDLSADFVLHIFYQVLEEVVHLLEF